MEAEKRIYLSRMAEKIERNKSYAERLGIKNRSVIKTGRNSR